MKCDKIRFTQHALRRMFDRGISPEDVRTVVMTGDIIEEYPDDIPYPSVLVLGWARNRPRHAVVAWDVAGGECSVVTVYIPDAAMWNDDFRTRR